QVTITWDDISGTLTSAAQMSGLAYMQAIASKALPAPPISHTLDFHLDFVEDGHAIFRGTPSERHFNPMGTVHGGLAATLIDSATGCAVHSTLPQGKLYGTA